MAATRKTPAKLDKTAWKKARSHEVRLPSGVEVTLEVPNLAVLVKSGYLPNELVQAAIGTIQSGRLTQEAVQEQPEFYSKIVTKTVKDPLLEPDDVIGDDPIPFEDIEMIVEIATRQRDMDAVGHHLGGLHAVKDWRTFRGLEHLYEAVESDEGGGTPFSTA